MAARSSFMGGGRLVSFPVASQCLTVARALRYATRRPTRGRTNMGMLDGKVAIVTGAGRGLGREEAIALARHGATVIVNDIGASLAGEGKDTAAAAEVVNAITH